jgi:hypothetical protein
MKNNLTFKLLVLLFITGFQLHAQDTDEIQIDPRDNEIRLDVFDAAFFTALDFSYERVADKDIGYGASLFLNFRDQDDNGYFENFAFTPFIRFYFFNNQDFGARGLFLEAFTKIAYGEDYDAILDFVDEERDYFDAAIGISIGKKWVHRRGFVLEISAGGGRNLGFDDDSPEFTFRGGISLGYRF